ncbi:hypothetical protein OESDEN_06996 [Oesophagostomum dentatum]|uniref:Nuclear condensin complex subunit 3 C-terminal domain-containing protein n=1 Tax=Oesophagostomum dentatum TaxID=61180 RepID=A0A0B1TBC2_OESDE|nr:hypothetical protein OESDEN_06996 [Oesophagostomum dentatum]
MARRKVRKPSPIPEEDTSRSASPELGFQEQVSNEHSNDTDTISTASSRQKGVKKRGPRITVNVDDSKLIEYFDEKILDAFQTVYTTTCGTAGPNYASQMLQAAFDKVNEQSDSDKARVKEIFFEKIQYRLCFMVDALTSIDNRRRVYRFLAEFCLSQWRKGIPDFIDFAIRFCNELSFCEDPAVRQNICTLTGFLLGQGRGKDVVGVARVLTVDLRRKLYSILLDRQCDKSGAVRREVILAAAEIQDDEIPNDFTEALERSPKDIILMGLRDNVADCRLTAAFALNVEVPEHADYLIQLASSDPATNVRVVAIRHLSRLPPTFFSEQQRMDLLRGVVFEEDPSIVDVLHNVLISEWLKFIHRVQEKRNRRRAECVEIGGSVTYIKEEIDESTIMNLSQNLRDMKTDHGYGSAALGLLSMLDFCDDPEAEKLARASFFAVFDVIREKLQMDHNHLTHFISSLVNDNTYPEVLSTHNYRTLLDRSLSGTDQAQYAFFWRTLIEYCGERSQNETERLECIYMLTPSLAEMCELVQRLKVSYEPSTDIYCCDEDAAQICDIHQVAILHLLGILRRLDHKDQLGMSEWKCLLFLILRDQFWSKEITDCAMEDLADFFFDDKPEQFLAALYDVIAEVINTAPSSSTADENVQPSLSPPKRPRMLLDLRQADDHTKRFCMQLTHSMLRTGAFKKFNPILQKVYDDIISPCLPSQISQLQIWAQESAAILGSLNQEIAKKVLAEIPINVLGKSDDEALKISVIDVVTDLIATYECKDILSWCCNEDPEDECTFINELIGIITCKGTKPLLCLKACECLAKILLMESFSNDEHFLAESLTALISRMFNSSISKLPAVRNCLECFFTMFPAVSRRNQLLIVAAFHELMNQIRCASEEDFILRIDIAGALNLIVGATSKILLRNAPDKKDGSVQPIFMREVLNYANGHPDDKCALLYWETAAALELNEFSSEELKETQAIVEDNIDVGGVTSFGLVLILARFMDEFQVVLATAGAKSKIAGEIQRLMRNVEHALLTYSTRKAEEAENGDCLTELRDKFARTPARGKRRTPKSSNSTPVRSSRITTVRKKKTSTSAKKTTQQVLNGQDTPSPPTVTSTLVTPVARSRPLLSRSAKRAATTKTRRWLFEKNDDDEEDEDS